MAVWQYLHFSILLFLITLLNKTVEYNKLSRSFGEKKNIYIAKWKLLRLFHCLPFFPVILLSFLLISVLPYLQIVISYAMHFNPTRKIIQVPLSDSNQLTKVISSKETVPFLWETPDLHLNTYIVNVKEIMSKWNVKASWIFSEMMWIKILLAIGQYLFYSTFYYDIFQIYIKGEEYHLPYYNHFLHKILK